MGWHQWVAIWLLSVALGGVASIGILLWIKRDKPRHRKRPAPADLWQIVPEPFRGDMLTADDLRILEYGAPLARAFLAGDRTPRCPECSGLWALPSPACPHKLWNLHPKLRPLPTVRERLDAWYGAREEAQTQQLLDAGAARWRS